MKITVPSLDSRDTRKAAPYVGQPITVRGVECRIVKVRPFGTLDVVAVKGNAAFRVTGLMF